MAGILRLLPLWVLLLTLSACFEPKEGCLDLGAVNFDASADKDCESDGCACIYPRLQVTVDQRYDSLAYRRDSTYLSTNGTRFRLHDVAFYLSDFEVVKSGVSYSVSDTLGLRVYGASVSDTQRQVFRNDFRLVRLETQQYPIGTFRESGIFSEVRIRLGLSAVANHVIAALAPATHPLARQVDSLWLHPAAGYVFMKVEVGRDVQSAQRDTLLLTRADMGDVQLVTSGQFVHVEGYDFPLRLRVDYRSLLGNINWSVGDKSSWKQQIIANLPDAFTVSQ